ncbi:Acetyl-CoA carboxylase, partial [Trachipleistophora hominis]
DMPVGIIYAYENGTCVLDAPSSEKFSTFIDQINAENLNLIIMANFKGFSGGDTDMKNGILKQGSKIIESLKTFKNKIFVYVGCGWQVRGGTFVILDKFINERIRVFVSMHGRIGIMQPSGLSEVKFKDKCRIKVLERNGLVVNDKNLNELAVKFCELHDHPERMIRKGRVDGMMEIDGLESAIYEYFCGD